MSTGNRPLPGISAIPGINKIPGFGGGSQGAGLGVTGNPVVSALGGLGNPQGPATPVGMGAPPPGTFGPTTVGGTGMTVSQSGVFGPGMQYQPPGALDGTRSVGMDAPPQRPQYADPPGMTDLLRPGPVGMGALPPDTFGPGMQFNPTQTAAPGAIPAGMQMSGSGTLTPRQGAASLAPFGIRRGIWG
jgi:hypothetical protein